MAYLIPIIFTYLLAAVESRQFLGSSESWLPPTGPRKQDEVDSRWNTIWTFWDYPMGPSPFVHLNIDTWQKHAPGMKVVFLNDTNMKDYVPDLPKEYYRLPYASAKSDFVRASVLYHHGGVYMDTDFLLMQPLAPLLKKLETHDIISYSDEARKKTGDCGTHYSSNFMAAKKGNGFSRTWWHNVRSKLTRKCEKGEWACEKVCCNEKGGPAKERRACHIPWAQLEHLKMPWVDADRTEGGPSLDPTQWSNHKYIQKGKKKCRDLHIGSERDASTEKPAEDIPHGLKLFCLKGDESMTPHLNGQIYWQPWDHEHGMTLVKEKRKMRAYDDQFHCKLNTTNDAMECNQGNWGHTKNTFPKFFNRQAYHLFFSTRAMSAKSKDEILQGDWVVSEMYRRSLGVQKI